MECPGHDEATYLQLIEELEVARFIRGLLDSLSQGCGPSAPCSPVAAAHGIKRSGFFGHSADQIQLSLGVGPAGLVRTTRI